MANKIPFRTAYSGQIKKHLSSGNPIQNEYSYTINSYGRKVLEKSGETDLYAKIQESLEETKIENILKRAAIGDTSVLRPDGIYADLTEMPNNLIEARAAIQNLENTWANLPQEMKAKYNNSVEDFIAASNTKQWAIDMGLIKEEAAPAKEEKTTPETKAKTEEAKNE